MTIVDEADENHFENLASSWTLADPEGRDSWFGVPTGGSGGAIGCKWGLNG